jgi:hypothetical protein
LRPEKQEKCRRHGTAQLADYGQSRLHETTAGFGVELNRSRPASLRIELVASSQSRLHASIGRIDLLISSTLRGPSVMLSAGQTPVMS